MLLASLQTAAAAAAAAAVLWIPHKGMACTATGHLPGTAVVAATAAGRAGLTSTQHISYITLSAHQSTHTAPREQMYQIGITKHRPASIHV